FRRRAGRRPCLLSRRRDGQGADRLAARQALRPGPAARLGLRGRGAARGPDPAAGRRQHARGQAARAKAAMIRETIVTTQARDGAVHIAPIGLIGEGEGFVIAPFRPSQTLENLRANPFAVANYTDDVLVFAGCLTGRRDWPT